MRLAITSSALRAMADVAKPYRSRQDLAGSSRRVPSRRFVWSTTAVVTIASLLFALTQGISA